MKGKWSLYYAVCRVGFGRKRTVMANCISFSLTTPFSAASNERRPICLGNVVALYQQSAVYSGSSLTYLRTCELLSGSCRVRVSSSSLVIANKHFPLIALYLLHKSYYVSAFETFFEQVSILILFQVIVIILDVMLYYGPIAIA